MKVRDFMFVFLFFFLVVLLVVALVVGYLLKPPVSAVFFLSTYPFRKGTCPNVSLVIGFPLQLSSLGRSIPSMLGVCL